MKRWVLLWSLLPLCSSVVFGATGDDDTSPAPEVKTVAVNQVIKDYGTYVAQGGTCEATLTRGDGDIPILSVVRSKTGKTSLPLGLHEDVNGFAWISPDELVYTALPGFGIPGMFSFSCTNKKGKEKHLVKATNKDNLDTDGMDFFQLHQIKDGKIIYYYAADADDVRDGGGPKRNQLYQVNLDGSQLSKFP